MNRVISPRSLKWIVLTFLFVVPIGHASAITLTGSNGRAVEFAGLKDATPKGITAQMQPEGDIIGIPWNKLDLKALETEHPLIFAAYRASQNGETISLNLGTFETEESKAMKEQARPARARFPGWFDTEIGGTAFAIQPPVGTAKAILLIAVGDGGRSMNFLTGFEVGTGIFGELQTKESVAIMSYYIDYRLGDPREMPEIAFAENKLADQILEAVSTIAAKSNRPDLVDLPFLVYGSERFGATVAYSFVQAKPEVVLAAVCAKGAFYNSDPTPASASVPILFQWGEYSNAHEIWNSEHPATSALERSRSTNSLWTGAIQFRGHDEIDQVTEYLGKKYLEDMLKARLREEKGEEEGPQGWIQPLDHNSGYIGAWKELTYEKIEGEEFTLEEGQTFIPSLTWAKLWKEYGDGSLEAPRSN